MDINPELLNSQIIIGTTPVDTDGDNTTIGLQVDLDDKRQDTINSDNEKDEPHVTCMDKNQNPCTEELNIINQEKALKNDNVDSSPDSQSVNENIVEIFSTSIEESEPLTSQLARPIECDGDASIYSVKWVQFNKSLCGIITQNSNGPCPLLAIVNVLLLKGKLSLPEGCQVISAEQLLEFLADLLISLSPADKNSLPDFQHNINDAISILLKLQTGLDVNVKFTGVRDFEYTSECIIFDLLSISLYHGWLVDPQQEETMLVVNSLSYNQLVENIIINRSSEDSSKVSASLVAQQFLEESASQLTYHGLCELNNVMREEQLAVFFRNNHFSTMYKHGGSIYLLVTDQGFLKNIDIVWETLDNIEGDTVFVNHKMNSIKPAGGSTDDDHILAMSLQQENETRLQKEREWQDFREQHLGDNGGLSDSELAARLQEAENAAVENERPGHLHTKHGQRIGSRNDGDKKCTIL